MLSDPGNRLAGGLGILTSPSAQAREAQLRGGLDVAERNADGATTLPMPTVPIGGVAELGLRTGEDEAILTKP